MTDYTPLRSQPIVVSPSFTRKSIPHPTLVLPLTPPATPPGFDFHKSSFANMQSEYPSRYARRHSGGSGSNLEDSPLILPTLISDDEEEEMSSPGGSSSSGILTPPSISVSEPRIADASLDHSMLNAFSYETTPTFRQDGFEGRPAYPLLSPMRKKQMWPHIERDLSPPTTPKGHPLKRNKSYFNFGTLKPISKPAISYKFTSYFAFLLRIPRRSRPAIMLLFCIMVFFGLHLSHAASVPASTSASPALERRSGVLTRPDVPFSQVLPRILAPRATDLPSIKFESADEELAALISFITSTSSNVLPALDPTSPLDPGAILDFDPTHPHARDDLDLLKEEIHNLYPLILFGKMRDPWHREMKKMIAEYKIVPAPLIIELDQRTDTHTFVPLLARLLGTQELPQVTLFGKSLGSYHEVLNLREKGQFRGVLEKAGLSVKAAKKSKKRVKEAEREENERILGPRPIVDGI